MRALAILLGAALLIPGCATGGGAPGAAGFGPDVDPGEVGVASYYARKFEGRRTASRFDSGHRSNRRHGPGEQ